MTVIHYAEFLESNVDRFRDYPPAFLSRLQELHQSGAERRRLYADLPPLEVWRWEESRRGEYRWALEEAANRWNRTAADAQLKDRKQAPGLIQGLGPVIRLKEARQRRRCDLGGDTIAAWEVYAVAEDGSGGRSSSEVCVFCLSRAWLFLGVQILPVFDYVGYVPHPPGYIRAGDPWPAPSCAQPPSPEY